MSEKQRIPKAAPSTITTDLEKEFRRVKRKLQTANDRQAASLAKSRVVCRALEDEPILRDDAMEYGGLSAAKSDTSLNPLTIATIGQSGTGKSTMNSALIQRSGIQSNASGKPLTACVTRTFMDIDPENRGEYAVLIFRTEAEIKALVERQIKNCGVEDFKVPDDIEDIPAALKNAIIRNVDVNPTQLALIDVVNQFIRHRELVTGPVEDRVIHLETSGFQRLHDVIREDSKQNKNPELRIVDIIKSVDIHLARPSHEDNSRLQLPDTCLVDTFGSGGKTTHAWGLDELLSEGSLDVILFCVNPRRITETEFDLARMINTAISEGKLHRTQILIIHNAKDEAVLHDESRTAISELIQVLNDGTPEAFDYHETSALAAIWALDGLRGNNIPNPEKYKSMAVALGLTHEDVHRELDDPELHKAVYNNSGIPRLIKAINELTRSYTVEARVKGAETSVRNTLDSLSRNYETEYERLAEQLNRHGNTDFKSVQLLAKREADAYEYVGHKRSVLLKPEPEIIEKLTTDASEILYTRLAEELPKIWCKNLVPDRLRTAPTSITRRPLPLTFVSDAEEWVLQELDLKPIGHHFAERIEAAFGEETRKKLLGFGLDTSVAADVLSVESVNEITRDVRREIIDFAAKVGKAMIGKPDYRLIPSDLSEDAPPAVLKILEAIANTRDVEPDNFEDVLNAIQNRYEPGIKEAVASIRGFHEAKSADVERDFGNLIFQTFITLQDNRNGETLVATLFHEVDDDIRELHLQKQIVDSKRARLKEIQALMTATDVPDTDASEA